MFKKFGSVLATLLGLLLLVYSATRSIDFISLTLPPDRQIMAWFGLAALDGGLVAWLLSYLYGSRGWQRAIALALVIVDFLGAVAMFTLDTLYNSGKAGMTARLTEAEMQTAVLALSLVIAINIAATVCHHMVAPDLLRRQAEEEAEAEIDDQTLEIVKRNARSLASKTAPQLASAWVAELEARYANAIQSSKARTKKALEGVGVAAAGNPLSAASVSLPLLATSPSPQPEIEEGPGGQDAPAPDKPVNPTPRRKS